MPLIVHTMTLPEKTWRALCKGLADYIERTDPNSYEIREVYVGRRRSMSGTQHQKTRPHRYEWGVTTTSLWKRLQEIEDAERVRVNGKPYRRLTVTEKYRRPMLCALTMALRTEPFNKGVGASSFYMSIQRHIQAIKRWNKLHPLEKLARQVD